jgi:hypothetical protein
VALFSLLWYDARESASCTRGNPAVPCYRMWARRSTDNGASWLSDQTFSDVISPLPAQPDPGIQATYAGDYDYASSSPNQHLHAWVDGRVTISGIPQQDAFHDRQSTGASIAYTYPDGDANTTPTPTPTPTATPTPTLTPTPTPTPGQIMLSARGYLVNGRRRADLTWNGATSNRAMLYRNSVLIATPRNDGFYTDRIGGRPPGSFTIECANRH